MLTRSHGLGNDYLVADPAELPFEVTPARVVALCDRHHGVGSDGLLVLNGASADGFGLRIVNPDGSEAEKSGNGIRIFGRWLFSTGRATGHTFVVRTPGGDVPVEVDGTQVTADMGVPTFRADLASLEVDGEHLAIVAVDIGNPHCVVPREKLDITELRRLGPLLERHPAFPNRTNVQLVHALDVSRFELLIWERGAGETQASGSSSCAAFAALRRLGQLGDHAIASMAGGELELWQDAAQHVWMRGPVEEVATITLSAELIARLKALP